MIHILGSILIIIELIILVAYIVLFIRKRMVLSKRNNYFFIPVTLLIFIVYCITKHYLQSNSTFFDYVKLIPKAVKFLAFDIEDNLINSMIEAVPLYLGVYLQLLFIVSLAWITMIVSLFGNKIIRFFSLKKRWENSCDIVVGYSQDSIQYALNYNNTILWLESNDKDKIENLKEKKILYFVRKISSKSIQRQLKSKEHHFIFFKDTQVHILNMINKFEGYGALSKVFLHFEAMNEEMKFIRNKYLSMNLEDNQIYLSCFNKHELLAREFVMKYPISKYLPRSFYNSNLTIKEDKKINVCFIGFGKVNIALFKMMAIEFQFATESQGKLNVLPVNYFAFDAEEQKLNNEYFTKLEFDFQHAFEKSDLPPMEKICNIEYKKLFAESKEAKTKLKSLVSKDSFTYFIISLSNDSENTGYADSLLNALEDYQDNILIFSRVKENRISDLNNISKSIIYFGEDREFLNHHRIINEDLMKLAGLVNSSYRNLSSETFYRTWQKEPIVEQYSNLFGALNVFHKMGMMNLELVKKTDEREEISKEEFESIYGSIDLNQTEEDYNSYDFYFKTTIKNVFAFVEHSRWNASYFFFDFKPMPFKDFYYNPDKKRFEHKDISNQKHACLTTYYALDELVKKKYILLKKEKGEDLKINIHDPDFVSTAQIYRYDYMMMDNVYLYLNRVDLKIVKSKSK